MPYSIFDQTIADMTYREVERAAARATPIIIPVGVIEQHGPHLPLGTDAYGAYTVARLIRRRLADAGTEILIAPPFYWGVNVVSSAFAGSIRTRPETARNLLVDLCTSLAEDGLCRQYLVNHHGDQAHLRMIHDAVTEIRAAGHTGVHWLEHASTVARLGADPAEPTWVTPVESDGYTTGSGGLLNIHATGSETVLIARYFSGLVEYDQLERLEPSAGTPADLEEWRKGGEHARRVTPDGYFGDPWLADRRTWQFYERTADALAGAIADHLAG
jgi:creatinine amidohydrolase